jgi:hypothetical protein
VVARRLIDPDADEDGEQETQISRLVIAAYSNAEIGAHDR